MKISLRLDHGDADRLQREFVEPLIDFAEKYRLAVVSWLHYEERDNDKMVGHLSVFPEHWAENDSASALRSAVFYRDGTAALGGHLIENWDNRVPWSKAAEDLVRATINEGRAQIRRAQIVRAGIEKARVVFGAKFGKRVKRRI